MANMFEPNFSITPEITLLLKEIEGLKEKIKNLPLTPRVIKTLMETARLQSVHYSTQIEGNPLSQKEVESVIKNDQTFQERQRDEREIRTYYSAIEWMALNSKSPITEDFVKTLHSLVEGEKTPISYRGGQNVIKDSINGTIVYMPPEAKDVPVLMKDFIEWIQKSTLPVPIIAAITHYQFVTIHPYYDGNGRTARLLTTAVLHKNGYDLKGIYSLEEYYAENLQAYYEAISIGNHHNYYFGRNEADITSWIEYFLEGMLKSFENVSKRMEEAKASGKGDKANLLRNLTQKQRKILALFEDKKAIASKDIESLFKFSSRSARNLCQKLVEEGFLKIENKADKTRSYILDPELEDLFFT